MSLLRNGCITQRYELKGNNVFYDYFLALRTNLFGVSALMPFQLLSNRLKVCVKLRHNHLSLYQYADSFVASEKRQFASALPLLHK